VPFFKRFVLTVALAALAPAAIAPARADDAPPAPAPAPASAAPSKLDVNQLFASICGWCHSNAGRTAGKGPQLMDTKRSDDFIRYRIKHGKEGAMPAFGTTFSDADIDQIIAYIRALKPN
jgi:mono/diheme cytochrome c family protein